MSLSRMALHTRSIYNVTLCNSDDLTIQDGMAHTLCVITWGCATVICSPSRTAWRTCGL